MDKVHQGIRPRSGIFERMSDPAKPRQRGRRSGGALYKKIAEQIEQDISAGIFPVGTLLPTEAEFSLRLDVGRHTVREALRLLSQGGLIVRRAGSGSTVVSNGRRHVFAHAVTNFDQWFNYPDSIRRRHISHQLLVADARLAQSIGCEVGSAWLQISALRTLDDVAEPISKVSSVTNELDIAVAAWHEDGRWTLGILPDPTDISQIITSLKSQQTNGGAIALISIDEEFFILIRVLGSHISLFLSDATCALDYPVAEELLEIADLPMPEDEDEANPIGHIEILSDLGMNGMEISALCDDAELFPDEQLEAIANRLGFGDQFAELLQL